MEFAKNCCWCIRNFFLPCLVVLFIFNLPLGVYSKPKHSTTTPPYTQRGVILSEEILERILQFADGETLLMCREVSPEFAAAVKRLSKTKKIWEKCYSKEKGEKYAYAIISKLHPHSEGFTHPKNWGVIYETCFLGNFIASQEQPYLGEFKIGKKYSDIQDVGTHEDLVLVLLKYNKDFSIFYRILTVKLDNKLIDKSCRFYANMVYVTPVEDASSMREGLIMLSCDLCHLVAVPVCSHPPELGFPRFTRNDNFLTVEHSNGEVLWINTFGKLLTKGNCFHTGRDSKPEEIKQKALKMLKVIEEFTRIFISCGEIQREFNTFRDLKAYVTSSFCYSDLLFLGTDTGMLYAFKLSTESELKMLSLQNHIWCFNVCANPILVINAMELKHQFVIICCSEKSLYHVHINRELKNFC